MWLLMYPLMAAYTEDKGVILFFGTLAGLFAFFITWTVQLAFVNKRIPVDRDNDEKVIEDYSKRKTARNYEEVFGKSIATDFTNPANPIWDD